MFLVVIVIKDDIDDEILRRIKDENIKVHNIEAEIYDTIHSEIFNTYEQEKTTKDVQIILREIIVKNPAVLDIGCGTGNLSLKFLKYGCKVTGVDVSRNMLDMLRKRSTSDSLELINTDVDSFLIRSGKKFDIICISSVLHHLPDYMHTLTNVLSMLNNGIIYITHEPLPKEPPSLFFSLIYDIDRLLFLIYLKLKKIKIPDVDYTYSDYQIELGEGINSDLIIKFFEDKGLEILYFEKYNVCKFSIFSYIENQLNRRKQHFKLIVRKKLI